MIHQIVGRQGSGKTLYLVKKAKEFYDAGFTIYSNVNLNFPYKALDYNDIINYKLENAMVIIDEIHQLLPSRLSMRSINRKICDGFLSMVRKKGLEVYGTTQYERKVDVRYREEKDYFYYCTKWVNLGNGWKETTLEYPKKTPVMIKLDIYDMFSGEKITKSFLANEYFSMYDTRQIIEIKGI